MMIIITHDYRSIGNPEMSDSFLIRPDKVLRVWDIREKVIGITFISSYDKYSYRIEVEGTSDKLLAKDLLNAIKVDTFDLTIEGNVKIK